jgi:hypothetical protein
VNRRLSRSTAGSDGKATSNGHAASLAVDQAQHGLDGSRLSRSTAGSDGKATSNSHAASFAVDQAQHGLDGKISLAVDKRAQLLSIVMLQDAGLDAYLPASWS